MKAICIELVDGKPELFLREVPKPDIGSMDLLVRVRAAGLNFADLYRAASHYGSTGQQAAAAIAGLEMAGEIVAKGVDVSGFAIGDCVMAVAAATYAEYCCVDHRIVMSVPAGLSWTDAAATPVAFMTAHDALVTNAELALGETVLVQAASSSVGIAAVQIAKHLGAGRVIGTSGSPEKLTRLHAFGMDYGIDTKQRDFANVVQELTDGRGADVIIENIGGDTLPGDVCCAAVKCRIVNVGRLGKWIGEIDLNEHSRKRIRLIGVTFRTRSVHEHAEVARSCAAALLPAIGDGKLRPVVDRVFALDQAAAAQDYMKSGRHFGKIVLSIS